MRYLLILSFLSGLAFANELPTNSTFAVITHKAGIAKGLAHNHFVTASSWQGSWEDPNAAPEAIRLSLTFPVKDLVVDDFQQASQWFPKIKELGILAEPYEELKDKDRKKIRKSMLGKSQLHAASFPDIKAAITAVTPKAQQMGTVSFSHELTVAITIKGKKVDASIPARIERTEQGLKLFAVCELQFTQFGIKPYSAMFGAVANQDRFHLLVSIGETTDP